MSEGLGSSHLTERRGDWKTALRRVTDASAGGPNSHRSATGSLLLANSLWELDLLVSRKEVVSTASLLPRMDARPRPSRNQ